MPPRPDRKAREDGLHLALDLEKSRIKIQDAAWVRRSSRVGLRRPVLAESSASPGSELVLYVIDEKGRVLDAFGWPAKMIAFFDGIDPMSRTSALFGSPASYTRGTRLLRVPRVRGARFLYFLRTDVTKAGTRKRGRIQQPLGLFGIGPGPHHAPPLPVPWPGHEPVSIEIRTEATDDEGAPGGRYRPKPMPSGKSMADSGFIKEVVKVVDQRPFDTAFNIAVMGDGFTERQLDDYDDAVSKIIRSLRSTPPFKDVWSKINVWSIRTASMESGITKCTGVRNCGQEPELRSTYYSVSGCCLDKNCRGYVGTDDTGRVTAAAELAVPTGYCDIRLVVANCHIYGGSAFPEQRLAFVTMDPGGQIGLLASHECAHVIAGLAEEYISCVEHDPTRIYPNQATRDDVSARTVWWKSLAPPVDLVNGELYVSDYGDVAPLDRTVGAFWGCQDGDGSDPARCDPSADVRGRDYFRPMLACRMRELTRPFCPVCAEMITAGVESVAP